MAGVGNAHSRLGIDGRVRRRALTLAIPRISRSEGRPDLPLHLGSWKADSSTVSETTLKGVRIQVSPPISFLSGQSMRGPTFFQSVQDQEPLSCSSPSS